MKRLGVITSGGDVPGLNACIRAVARTAIHHGVEIYGVQRGYAGLMQGDLIELTVRSVGGILERGGTILGTARCEEFKTEAGQLACIQQIQSAKLDGLIVIGGNGSLAGALELHKRGVSLIGIPKTIDNDQHGTDIAIGVDTALNTIAECVSKIKDTATSHQRAFLVETMGRNCGYLALASGIITGAKMVLIPEKPIKPRQVAETIRDSYESKRKHCIIMVAEGWKPGTQALKTYLEMNDSDEGFDVREIVLGHIQRGGAPSAFDRMLATRMGCYAVERMLDGKSSGNMVSLRGNEMALVSLKEATSHQRQLDSEMMRLAGIMEQ
jgi:6-phosphofructokinase 1